MREDEELVEIVFVESGRKAWSIFPKHLAKGEDDHYRYGESEHRSLFGAHDWNDWTWQPNTLRYPKDRN